MTRDEQDPEVGAPWEAGSLRSLSIATTPAAQAAFWAAVLGYEVVHSDDHWVEIAPWEHEPADLVEQVRRAPGVPTLVFVTVPEGKTAKNRLHLDVSPIDRSQEAEVERLIGLGARHADVGQGTQHWVVLADPEGMILRDPPCSMTGTASRSLVGRSYEPLLGARHPSGDLASATRSRRIQWSPDAGLHPSPHRRVRRAPR
jgi:catechol 2,3-dioxygenase-like lactoylglutathione lyase family enzyme